MRKALSVAILLFLLLTAIALAIAVRAQVSSSLFSDHFDGTTIDTTKWVVEQNVDGGSGGSATVADSYVSLTSDGTSFPVLCTADNPFPTTSGDFTLSLN